MKIGMNVGDRLITMSILPKEGSFVTLKVIRSLMSRLGVTSQEIADYEIVEQDGQVRWNLEGTKPLDFEFDSVELELIRNQLMKMDRENRLNIEVVPIYEKFCG